MKLAYQAKAAGAISISLIGGEPTLHPELSTIIREITNLGLRTILCTNGLRIGKDFEYAKSLKDSGLHTVHFQFDSFNEKVHEKMRGNKFIPEKIQAFHYAKAAQLKLGIVTTVTRFNISEIGEILEFGLKFVPQLYIIVFQAVAHIGRYMLPLYEPIDREQIIHTLIDSKVIRGLTTNHFWPMPTFYPWQLGVHPDCVANLFLVIDSRRVEPLDNYVNMANLYRRLQMNCSAGNKLNKIIMPLYYLLCEARPGRLIKLLRFLKGFTNGEGKRGMVLVMMGEFLSRDYQDIERLKGCAGCYVTTRGHISCCCYYRPDQKYRLLLRRK